MNNLWHPENSLARSGFTLIELLVAIAMASIILVAIAGLFQRLSRSYTTQNAYADLQQGIRSTLDVMADDIRMAGYNPTQSGVSFGIEKAEAFRLRLTVDRNENGLIDTAPAGNEIITYLYAPAQRSVQKRWSEGRPQQTSQPLFGGTDNPVNVIFLSFNYLDGNNQPTTILSAIQAIVITLVAEEPAGRANDPTASSAGMVRRTYRTRVECRNL
ncbi:MAG TPA: prepilin-type N-terminal cleavage/methylation domain-containing protein [Desulfobulbaceae bacterium]|nr:prepilin-type N-terminal cleavage/methylation domain-containing protein [Desulfobulbaceae bacterium]